MLLQALSESRLSVSGVAAPTVVKPKPAAKAPPPPAADDGKRRISKQVPLYDLPAEMINLPELTSAPIFPQSHDPLVIGHTEEEELAIVQEMAEARTRIRQTLLVRRVRWMMWWFCARLLGVTKVGVFFRVAGSRNCHRRKNRCVTWIGASWRK